MHGHLNTAQTRTDNKPDICMQSFLLAFWKASLMSTRCCGDHAISRNFGSPAEASRVPASDLGMSSDMFRSFGSELGPPSPRPFSKYKMARASKKSCRGHQVSAVSAEAADAEGSRQKGLRAVCEIPCLVARQHQLGEEATFPAACLIVTYSPPKGTKSCKQLASTEDLCGPKELSQRLCRRNLQAAVGEIQQLQWQRIW